MAEGTPSLLMETRPPTVRERGRSTKSEAHTVPLAVSVVHFRSTTSGLSKRTPVAQTEVEV